MMRQVVRLSVKSQPRLVQNRSRKGAQRNFNVHGRASIAVKPIADKDIPCSRKREGRAFPRSPEGRPCAKYRTDSNPRRGTSDTERFLLADFFFLVILFLLSATESGQAVPISFFIGYGRLFIIPSRLICKKLSLLSSEESVTLNHSKKNPAHKLWLG